jgi:hypothetical protein
MAGARVMEQIKSSLTTAALEDFRRQEIKRAREDFADDQRNGRVRERMAELGLLGENRHVRRVLARKERLAQRRKAKQDA